MKTQNNISKRMQPKVMIPLILVAVLVLVPLLAFLLRYKGLEEQAFFIPSFSKPDTLKVPPRPGVGSIVITGPVLEDLIFDLDLRTAGLRPINWNRLSTLDPTARVTVRARVSSTGELNFSRANKDIQDSGYPEAGKYIEQVLSTWKYFPHKTGTIRFYFNVGSRGNKVIIDANENDLRKSPDVPDKIRVRNGQMYYIQGLNSSQVGYGSVSLE